MAAVAAADVVWVLNDQGHNFLLVYRRGRLHGRFSTRLMDALQRELL